MDDIKCCFLQLLRRKCKADSVLILFDTQMNILFQ